MILLFIIACSYLDDSDLKCYSLERRTNYLNNEIEYLGNQASYLKSENLEKRLSDTKYSIAKISIKKRLHKIDEEIYDIEKKVILNNCKGN